MLITYLHNVKFKISISTLELNKLNKHNNKNKNKITRNNISSFIYITKKLKKPS